MHLSAGIGVAVVVEDELSVVLRQMVKDLDFGLWNCGEAISTFRLEGSRRNRQMSVFFDNANHHAEVEVRRGRYEAVLAQAFLADSVFEANHVERLAKTAFKVFLGRPQVAVSLTAGVRDYP